MVVRLGETLDLPLRERNDLLVAAGFAPLFRESGLSAPQMAQIRVVLTAILKQQEPYPAIVLDRRWDIQMMNDAAIRTFGRFIDVEGLAQPVNLVRLMFDPAGMRPFVKNWAAVSAGLLHRLRREAVGGILDRATTTLLSEVAGDAGQPRAVPASTPNPDLLPVIPVELEKDGLALRFFSAVTILGTPKDVTSEEIRVECFFPVDDATAKTSARLAAEDRGSTRAASEPGRGNARADTED